ncbi:MAG: hypothetical protein U5N10_12280 [Gemmobacter sp.]|nr:hypothetical protein [Gemmobacter sp.]
MARTHWNVVAGLDCPAPAARAVWAAPAPSVTVVFLESDTRVGGREISLCKVAGQADIRCECGWLDLVPPQRSVNYEVISADGVTHSAALVTADFDGVGAGSRLVVTVQLSSLAADMAEGYRQGFEAGLDNLAHVAERTMILQRLIGAPRPVVWGAWMNPETLPRWWGPDGFSCRTKRIDLRLRRRMGFRHDRPRWHGFSKPPPIWRDRDRKPDHLCAALGGKRPETCRCLGAV